MDSDSQGQIAREVHIRAGTAELQGDVVLPAGAGAIVVFAHGSGSSRRSPRNLEVAALLQQAGLGTLLFDLLTPAEAAVDAITRRHRFDIPLLGERLLHVTNWIAEDRALGRLRVGYFGASTGSAAALVAAAGAGSRVSAIVSRGGRPDLAEDCLDRVEAATLLIVGGEDLGVLSLNEEAYERLTCVKRLVVVPGATHLFEERGAMEEVAALASDWFLRHLEVAGRA